MEFIYTVSSLERIQLSMFIHFYILSTDKEVFLGWRKRRGHFVTYA